MTHNDKVLSKTSLDDFHKIEDEKREQEIKSSKKVPYVTFLFVNGLSNKSIGHRDMRTIFENAQAPNFLYFYKFGDRNSTEGYAVMANKEEAVEALRAINEKYGDEFAVQTSISVKISEMPEHRLDEARKSYEENHKMFIRTERKKSTEKKKEGKKSEESKTRKKGKKRKRSKVFIPPFHKKKKPKYSPYEAMYYEQ